MPYCLKSCRKPCLNQRWKKKMRAHIKVEISDFFQQIETTDNTVPTFLHGNTPLKPTSNCFLRWILSMLLDFYDPLFSLRLRSVSGSIFSTGTAVKIKTFSLSAPIVKLLKKSTKINQRSNSCSEVAHKLEQAPPSSELKCSHSLTKQIAASNLLL